MLPDDTERQLTSSQSRKKAPRLSVASAQDGQTGAFFRCGQARRGDRSACCQQATLTDGKTFSADHRAARTSSAIRPFPTG
ncbi:MAG: hypothetical protein K6A82_03835 [Prevotella sp.]|nr:hypothetical protein [Prevotella sp.]